MGQMIKFEHDTLVLNNVFSKQDVAEIDRFAEYVRNQEQERIIKLLRERARHLMQVSESIAMDEYMSDEDAAVPENGAFALNEFADALIKGEK